MDPLVFVIILVAITFGSITTWVKMATKDRGRIEVSPDGDYDIDELAAAAESLKERVDTLESILDAEIPDWREQHDREGG